MPNFREYSDIDLATRHNQLIVRLDLLFSLYRELNPDATDIAVYYTVTQNTKVGSDVADEIREIDLENSRREMIRNPPDDCWTR